MSFLWMSVRVWMCHNSTYFVPLLRHRFYLWLHKGFSFDGFRLWNIHIQNTHSYTFFCFNSRLFFLMEAINIFLLHCCCCSVSVNHRRIYIDTEAAIDSKYFPMPNTHASRHSLELLFLRNLVFQFAHVPFMWHNEYDLTGDLKAHSFVFFFVSLSLSILVDNG